MVAPDDDEDKLDPFIVQRNVESLNPLQRECYDKIVNTILHQNNMCREPCRCILELGEEVNSPIRMLLSGVDGSGRKSNGAIFRVHTGL